MEIDCQLLLQQVQQHECLYDPRSENYKDRTARVDAWDSICSVMVGDTWEDMTRTEKANVGKEIQKKWKSLKDAYVRCLRNRKEKNSKGLISTRPYIYERQMTFLNGTVKSKRKSDASNAFNLDASEDLIDGDSDDTVATVDSPTPDATENSFPPIKKSRNAVDEPESEPAKSIQHDRSQDFSQPTQVVQVVSNVSLVNEEDKMFLMSLLPQLMDMSTMEKLDFKINVLKLLKTSVENKEKSRSGRI